MGLKPGDWYVRVEERGTKMKEKQKANFVNVQQLTRAPGSSEYLNFEDEDDQQSSKGGSSPGKLVDSPFNIRRNKKLQLQHSPLGSALVGSGSLFSSIATPESADNLTFPPVEFDSGSVGGEGRSKGKYSKMSADGEKSPSKPGLFSRSRTSESLKVPAKKGGLSPSPQHSSSLRNVATRRPPSPLLASGLLSQKKAEKKKEADKTSQAIKPDALVPTNRDAPTPSPSPISEFEAEV